MKCAVHNKKANGFCVNCGRGVCENCLVETSKGNYCKECFRRSNSPKSIKEYAINEILNNKVVSTYIVAVIIFFIIMITIILIRSGSSPEPGADVYSGPVMGGLVRCLFL